MPLTCNEEFYKEYKKIDASLDFYWLN